MKSNVHISRGLVIILSTILFILAMLIVVSNPSEGLPLLNEHRVSDDSNENQDPYILEDSQGNLNLAWKMVDNDPDGNIYFARSEDRISWNDPIQVTTYFGKDKSPIFSEEDGTLYLTFTSTRDGNGQGKSGDIYLTISEDGGDTWDTPSYVAGKYPHGEGAGGIVVDGDTIWIAYHEAYGDDIIQYVIKSLNGGQTWETPVKISSDSIVNSGAMIQDSDGSLLLTFAKESDDFFKVYRSLNGQSWSEISSQKLYTPPEKMDLIIDDSDIYWLVTYGVRDGDTELFITRSDDLIDWGPLNRLTYEDGVDRYPSIVANNAGELDVYWDSDRSGESQIYTGRIDYDDDFLPYDYPCIFVDESGKHYMVMRNNEDIWFSKSLDGIEWSEPTALSVENEVERSPRITQDEEGNLYVTFASRKGGSSGRIWFTTSSDDGETWTNPVHIAGSFPYGNGPNGIGFLSNDRLVISWHTAYDPSNTDAMIITSDDKGQTWNIPRTATIMNIDSRNLDTINDIGNAIMVVNSRSNHDFHFLSSYDGDNWFEISYWDSGATSRVTQASIYQNDDDIFWLAWRLDDNGGEIWYSTSNDLKNWEDPQLIADNSQSPFLYEDTRNGKATIAWASDWDGEYQQHFQDLDTATSATQPPSITLLPVDQQKVKVQGGNLVVEMTAVVEDGDAYNLMLNVVDNDGFDIAYDQPIRTASKDTSVPLILYVDIDIPCNLRELEISVEARSIRAFSNTQIVYHDFEVEDILAFSYPSIYVDDDGKHYMVMRDDENICFSKSSDGVQWSDPRVVSANDEERTPRITKGDNGTLYVTFSSRKDASSDRVWFTKSYDDGTTWNSPKYIAGSAPSGNGPNGIGFLSDGRLLISWHRASDSSHTDAKYITSDDNGATWNTAGSVTTRNIASRNLFCIDKDGKALMVVNDRASNIFYFLRSSDGENWNEVASWDK